MPTFAYQAVDDRGRLVRGELSADDEQRLAESLEAHGLTLVELAARERRARAAPRSGRLRAAEVGELAEYVAVTSAAGLPVVSSIADFAAQASPAMAAALSAVVRDVQGGTTLSEAFARRRGAFDENFLSLLRAGEFSGTLTEGMRGAAKQIRFQLEVRGQVRAALVQPCITLLGVVGLVVLLLTFLLPRILGMLQDAHVALPATTQLLMDVSAFLTGHAAELLGGVVVAVVAAKALLRTGSGRLLANRVVLRLPVLGPLLGLCAQARFTSTMATLIGSGVDAVRSLRLAADASGAPALARHLHRAADTIASGSRLGEAMDRVPGLHPLVRRMLQLGDASGNLEEALGPAVAWFAEEIPRRVKRALALLEPAILAGSGLLVGFILLSAIMPILTLYENI